MQIISVIICRNKSKVVILQRKSKKIMDKICSLQDVSRLYRQGINICIGCEYERCASCTEEHPAIHQDLVEVRWFNTAEVQPANGQKVIVRTQTGEVYFLTYPFNHTKYPQWWVLPKDNNQ